MSEQNHNNSLNSSKPKRSKATAVKCANGCHRTIQYDDSFQKGTIQCGHQGESYTWISDNKECSRWLCNYSGIELTISIDSLTWFWVDHVGMYKEDDNFEEESHSN